MKRGEVYLAEIKECLSGGLWVNVGGKEVLLPAEEIKDGLKQEHKEMVGWLIPIRVKSLRPFAVSNMRLDKSKLSALGLRDAKPIEKVLRTTTSANGANKQGSPTEEKEASKEKTETKKMELNCRPLLNGIMAYWDKVEDAAVYYVHLFIGARHRYKEIAAIEVPRNIAYYSFLNLAKIANDIYSESYDGFRVTQKFTPKENRMGDNYYVYVEAENRAGETISKTDMVLGDVYIMEKGSYSY